MVSLLIETFEFLDTKPAYMVSLGLLLTANFVVIYQFIQFFIWGCWLHCPPVEAGRKKQLVRIFLFVLITCVIAVSHLSYGVTYGKLCCIDTYPSESDFIKRDRYERN